MCLYIVMVNFDVVGVKFILCGGDRVKLKSKVWFNVFWSNLFVCWRW